MTTSGFGSATPSSNGPATVDYGTDWSCTDALDPNGAEVSGRLCLAQALLRRLLTPRGGLITDPDYGYEIGAYLNDDLTAAQLASIAGNVDAELRKDPRVADSRTTVSFDGQTMTVSSQVLPSAGPSFALVVSIDQVTATLLQPTS